MAADGNGVARATGSVGPAELEFDEALAAELNALEERGLRRDLLPLSDAGPGRVVLGGQVYLDLASNDYLGLAQSPLPENLLRDVATGARASRLVTGDLDAHRSAEATVSQLVERETALLFSSGYAANAGTIPALVGRGDLVLSDTLNHASLIDGCRLSRARVVVFRHGDMEHLRELLSEHRRAARRALIVTESVFSMEGDRAPLGRMAALAKEHGAWLMVDEAHSVGVLGRDGRGLCAELGIRPEVVVGTLGKAFGASGAFVAGSETLWRLLIHRARSFVFSTGVSPIQAAIVTHRTQQVREAEGARQHQAALAARLAEGLMSTGLEVRGRGPIVTAVYRSPRGAVRAELVLRSAGIIARAIRPPTVPAGTSRVRFVPTAAHSFPDIEKVIETLRAQPLELAGSRT